MYTIRELRRQRGWSQVELAYRLGVTPATVYHWEHDHCPLAAVMLRRLAQLFEVRMEDIALPCADRPRQPRGRQHNRARG
jgi:transcriptional regulator with XRE-family HTH domain